MEIIKQETLAQQADALTRAQALVIDSNEAYAIADAFSVGLLHLEKAIKADFKDSKESAHATWKAIVAQESGHLEKVQEARAIIRPKLQQWEVLKQKEADAEAARLRAQAQKEAEDRALAQAAEFERDGDTVTAQAIVSAPVRVDTVVVAPAIPKRQTVIPQAWTYRVVNPKLVPREYLIDDSVKLNGVARATKGSITVPGIEFFDKNKAA